MDKDASKLKIAVHKFSSCDGCQLAFLNAGEALLSIAERFDITFFAEAGLMDDQAHVDIAFIEGSISTAKDEQRIRNIREHSRILITIGACATAGGLQALKNLATPGQWTSQIYAQPEFIDSLDNVAPIAKHVQVDYELWGCPIDERQLLAVIDSASLGVFPAPNHEKLCQQCKRQQIPCVMVTQGKACLGPITKSGCGALCPAFGRDCYGCYGPADNIDPDALGIRLKGLGMQAIQIAQHYHAIYSDDETLRESGKQWMKQHD